jgi:radical SAM protein with 4Fe4S-binding SPASM domain
MKIISNKEELVELRKEQVAINQSDVKIPLNALRSISINPTEMCNRKCHFCPRTDPKIYKNQRVHISKETIQALSKEMKKNNYLGKVSWSGFGEPMMNPELLELVSIIRDENPDAIQEINTNGDYLKGDVNKIDELYDAGITYIIISLYDGPEQLEEYKKLFEKYDPSTYALRISYYEISDFENFSNRAGAVKVNVENIPKYRKNKCFVPFYKLQIDWNGDILVCCEDWFRLSKKLNNLNINTHSLKEIWESDFLTDYRKKLSNGDRSNPVCNRCNVNGEKLGGNYVEYFKL